jgi:hypothetical protein
MDSNGSRRCKFRQKKDKFFMDWSHTKKRRWRNTEGRLTVERQGNRKRGEPKNSWRRSVIKEAGRSWKELMFLGADRSGEN